MGHTLHLSISEKLLDVLPVAIDSESLQRLMEVLAQNLDSKLALNYEIEESFPLMSKRLISMCSLSLQHLDTV